MEQLTKNQAVATSQEAVQNQNEPQLRDENAHNDKSVHGVLNPTYQAGLRRDAVQPDIEAERKKRDEIEDRKSGSAGMPRPISYAVFCLKKKNELQPDQLRVALRSSFPPPHDRHARELAPHSQEPIAFRY